MPSRIYLVTDKGRPPRLVEATHPAQAVGHVARASITAEIASQQDLVDLVRKGTRVEKAGEVARGADRRSGAPYPGLIDERRSGNDRRVASNGGV